MIFSSDHDKRCLFDYEMSNETPFSSNVDLRPTLDPYKVFRDIFGDSAFGDDVR